MRKLVQILYLFFALAVAMASFSAKAAIDVAGWPAYQPASDAGLYIWRAKNGNWSFRMSAGGGSRKFNGVIESTRPFVWFSRVSIESNDSVVKASSTQIDLSLQAWGAGEDGINFAIPEGAGLCLRSLDDVNTTVYVGGNAVSQSTPLDLMGSGACGNVSKTVSSGRKYNPGHYIAMVPWGTDDHPAMIASIKPGVVGFHKRYHWRELEPSLGKYDFSQIQRDLDLLAGQGMQLIIQIEDKSFNSVKPTPSYLWKEYTRPNKAGGHTAVRYAPYVVTRMKALIRAMGQRFDAHPNFEGVAIQESATGFSDATLNATGYTPETYRDALIAVLKDASQSFSGSRVFWYMNFLSRSQAYLGEVASAVAPLGVVMGGPDALPDDYALKKLTYPFYDHYKGQMPLFCSAQFNSYKHLHQDSSYQTKYWTMDELFRFMRDDLHVNYVFWTRKTWSNPSGSYDWTDALQVIESNPAFNY